MSRSPRIHGYPQAPSGPLSYVEQPHAECGGAPTSLRLGGPCGSSVPRIAGEGEACLLPPPCQPLAALSCEGLGTQFIIPNDVSGGSPADPTLGIPCGRSALDSAPDRDASRHVHRSEPSGALSPGCMRPSGSSILAASGGSSQCSQLGDPCDPSACTGSTPSLSSSGQRAMAGCCTPATSVANRGSSETLSPGCLRRPGNILNDVSGVFPLSSALDGPCDRSALGDGPRLLQSTVATSNFLEFASPPDILHQQVVEQQQVVEGSTTPFHPQRLTSPSSPPPGDESAMLLQSASRVNSTSKHGDGSGITDRHVDGTTFQPPGLNVESAPCV